MSLRLDLPRIGFQNFKSGWSTSALWSARDGWLGALHLTTWRRLWNWMQQLSALLDT